MTSKNQLEEIRKRDADSAATWFKVPAIGACGRAFIDRRWLLGEVARLRTELAKWETNCTGKHGSQVPCSAVETSAPLTFGYATCNSGGGSKPTVTIGFETLSEAQAMHAWLIRSQRSAVEPEVARPQLEWEVTYDVVAYNESWGGYGDNASKNGFQSAEEAIAYAKPLGVHLDATVWQRTKPKSVTPAPSIKIWSAENGEDKHGR